MKKILVLLIVVLSSQMIYAQKFEGLALTPPMGWSSWNKFHCDINEQVIMEIADAMVRSGMKDAGYEYINIDDCWQIDRDKDGNIIVDPEKFPSGMKALADYVHSKGLKFGLYTCVGTQTCMKRPGSRGYEYQDARTYASWGVDFVKADWCNHGKQLAEPSYTTLRDAIYQAGRPMVLSICEWGTSEPWTWGKDVGHMWRTTLDIANSFEGVINWGALGALPMVDKQVEIRKYSGPGHWNDLDMLEIGNGELTAGENRAHFSMWCILAAPLIAGNDLRDMTPEIVDVLTNDEVIAVDQDPLGVPGLRWVDNGDFEIWFKPMQNGDYILCFLNRDEQPYKLNFDFRDKTVYDGYFGRLEKHKMDERYQIRDLWKHKDIGTTAKPLVATIPAHDVLMVRLSKLPSKVTIKDYKVFYDGQDQGLTTINGRFAKDADHDNKLTGVFVGGEKVGDLNTSQRSYLIISNNRGKSWSEPVLFGEELLFYPDEPEREGLRLALTGPTQKGTLLCTGDQFFEGKEGSGVLKDVNWRPHDLIIGRKERSASKWTYTRYPSGTFLGEQFTTGTALQLPDGRILYAIWGAKNKGENVRCGVLISDDDGMTWKYRDVAYEPDLNIRDHPAWGAGFNEQSLFLTPAGKIVSIIRGSKKLGRIADSPKDTWFFRTESTDRGETWSKPELTNLPGTGAADIGITLADGSFLLASRIPYSRDIYELPDPELYGLQFARSFDEGKTWRPEYIFQEDPEGHPFSHYYDTMNGQFLKINDHEWLYIFGEANSNKRLLSFKVIVQ